MMSFEELKNKAANEVPDMEIKQCTDIGNEYVFSFGVKGEDDVVPGTPFVRVSKDDGKCSFMTVPPIENLELLAKGKEISII